MGAGTGEEDGTAAGGVRSTWSMNGWRWKLERTSQGSYWQVADAGCWEAAPKQRSGVLSSWCWQEATTRPIDPKASEVVRGMRVRDVDVAV